MTAARRGVDALDGAHGLRYRPGDWTCLAAGGTVVLLPPAAPQERVAAVWDLIRPAPSAGNDASLENLLTAATGGFGQGLADIPGFAVILWRDGGAELRDGAELRALLRGPVTLTCGHGAGERRFSGADVTTWTEVRVPDAGAVTLVVDGSAAGAAAHSFPLLAGVVAASEVRLGAEIDDAGPRPEEDARQRPVEDSPLAAATVEDASEASEQTLLPVEDDAEREQQETPPAQPVTPREQQVTPPAQPVEPPAHSATAPAQPRTLIDSVPWIRRAAPPDPGPPAAASTAASADDDLGDTIMSPRLPDARPGTPATPATPATEDTEDTDDSEDTVLSAPAASRGPAGIPDGGSSTGASGHEPAAAGNGPLIPARLCPAGHPNPPTRGTCRVCAATLEREVRQVRRPPLGRMRTSAGEVLELDRGVVVGRQPSVSRVQGDVLPRIVTVGGAGSDISRSHVEVRLEGWHVMLADLKATNGTVLLREGQAPHRMGSGEVTILLDGDVAQLGDGVFLRFEDLP